MINLKFLNVKISDIVNYDPSRVYNKGEICLFGNRLYKSNFSNNKNDSPILGTKWDQIL